MLSLVGLGGAGVAAYVASVLARVDRVELGLDAQDRGPPPPRAADLERQMGPDDGDDAPAAADAADGSEGTGGGDGVPEDDAPEAPEPPGDVGPPVNVLLVGSDDVTGVGADEAILTGRDAEAANSLADTIMVLRLDPSTPEATLVSVPRDLWVPIAGTDGSQRVNAAFSFADDDDDARADRLTATVRDALEIPIHHFVHVNWAGFRELVDITGGIELCFDAPRRDVETGFSVQEAGRVELGGDAALAYVRSRSMQEQAPDGTWHTIDLRADLDRIPRQQAFLRVVLDQTKDLRGLGDVVQLQRLVETGLANVQLDQRLSVGRIVDLLRRYRSFSGEELSTSTLDVVDDTVRFRGVEASVVRLVDNEANRRVLDVFRGLDPDDVVPARVQVRLRGATEEAAARLEALGFVTSAGGLGAAVEGGAALIGHGPGGERAALLVAGAIAGPVRYELDPRRAPEVITVTAPSTGLSIGDAIVAPATRPPTAGAADPADPADPAPSPEPGPVDPGGGLCGPRAAA